MDRFRRPIDHVRPGDDDTPVAGRRPHRGSRAALALAVIGMIASALALVPADPADARITNPLLIVGGHGNVTSDLEGWADFLAHPDRLDLPLDKARGLQLQSLPGLWPGTESNEDSAWEPGGVVDDVYDAIMDLSNDYGGARVEVMGVSQGALVVRWLLQANPNNIRNRVASYISFSGVNAGIPDFLRPLDWCSPTVPVCQQMVWDTPADRVGETDWLMDEVNMWDYDPASANGDPTPGAIPYFHIYTTNDEGATNLPDYNGQEYEALRPYGWSLPLHDATNRSAQDECGADYVAPHGGWTGTTPDPVMLELLLDALHRRPLDAPPC